MGKEREGGRVPEAAPVMRATPGNSVIVASEKKFRRIDLVTGEFNLGRFMRRKARSMKEEN